MRTKFSFQSRLATLFVIVILTVTLTGLFAYQNLSGLLASARQFTRPDLKLAQIKSLNNEIKEAEVEAKAYNLTTKSEHLSSFYKAVNQVDQKMIALEELSKEHQQKMQSEQVRKLVDQKFAVLNNIIQLQGANRAEEALEKVSMELKTKANKISNKENDNPGILQRVFGLKKGAKKEEGNTEVLASEIEKSIDQIKKEEQLEETIRSEQELQLTVKSDSIDQALGTLVRQMEEDARHLIATKLALNQKQAKRANIYIVAFCILAALMLAFMFYLIFRHLDNNRKYRRVLKKAKNRAEELAQAKERFVANMSHEIRTPLNALLGFVDQVLQGQLKPAQREQLQIAQKSGLHLVEVVNEILDFSKLSAQKFSFVKLPFQPKEVLQDVEKTFETRCKNKGLDFHLYINDDTPNWVLGDEHRLKQILFNLVGNSVKFTEKGTISIFLKPKLMNKFNCSLEFKVQDTGIGIPDHKIDEIFEEFEQVHGSLDDAIGSTGLGLNITKMLVEQQHGKLSIKSKINEGSTVLFEIPFELSLNKNDEAPIEQNIDPKQIANKTVLIADDNVYNRKLLATILEKWKLTYTEVENGLQAIEEMDKHAYDLVLMDIRMPEMDGFAASKHISKNHNTTIIAVTAGISPEEEKKCKDCGMKGFLGKPFREVQLFNVLVNCKTEENNPQSKIAKSNDDSTPLFNLQDLISMSQGNQDFVSEMVQLFIDTTYQSLSKAEKHSEAGNWALVAEYTHKMAGPCRHLEAYSLLKMVKEIEAIGRGNQHQEQIPKLLIKAQKQADKICQQLEIKLAELQNK